MAKKTTEHSPLFEKYKKRYDRGGCTKAQLHRLVELGALTAEEYEEITGEPCEDE
ncbi:MAG: XkdX family protein [Bacteroidales bacterium]|nr:XkdX family protein [Bacteroidales bacterium]